jgi:uncharacterized protein YjbI with pentapeptide repeats
MPLPYAVLALVAVVVFVVLAYVRGWSWTGFTEPRAGDDHVRDRRRTLWDWLQLLVVPLVIALVAFLLSDAQSRRQDARERRDANRQRALERSASVDDAREGALRAYVEQMSDLLLTRDLAHSRSASARQVARTNTLTVLRRLDGPRKGLVLGFLEDAGLLIYPEPRVRLDSADLRGAVVRNSSFLNADFGGADLRRADFRGSSLVRPHWSGANLRDADFRRTESLGPDFAFADLRRANFRGARLDFPVFSTADLRGADFSDAYIARPKFINVCLTDARFARVDLSRRPAALGTGRVAEARPHSGPHTAFDDAFGRRVNFAGTDLRDSILAGLHLADPDLAGAQIPDGWRPSDRGGYGRSLPLDAPVPRC